MKYIPAVLIMLLSLAVVPVYAQDHSETARIQYLLASVEALDGASFIRNGREYDASTAAKHLRLKLRSAGDKVRTAEDFVELCASKSSMTGEPYLIRFADGTTVTSEAFFRNKLKTFAAHR
jgi:hypothetical protein